MSEAQSAAFTSAVETLDSKLREREELLLCVDFDGTLSPVVEDPDSATMLPENRAALEALQSHPDVTVAVVSGRELSDVRSRVGLTGVTYAGNHGLELRTEGTTKVHPVAKERKSDVERLSAELRGTFEEVRGVHVEDKGQTLTVHHRRAADAHAERARRTVARLVGEFGGETLTVSGDEEIIEVRPSIDWDKGSIVSSLLHDRVSCLPVFVGDSRTDEAGFRAVERDGVGIRVGEPDDRATAATEFVSDPAETAALLEWFQRTGVDRLTGPPETTQANQAGPTGTSSPSPSSSDDRPDVADD
ncbi:trehalose-phosphatase [Halogeometricum pallidum JCM 14848]|uniref:Trehalose 6-phosphate phosphatase n=1 Tax=Halogeometricum pallidum JCM 14848 TaxID=1227487 RepID=M0D6H7_HALPD|nr:trehalose-phosphatase [Halogeometricum pallidum]ELZ31091.1 trehalose-phosphatase [Halogeometricum pallidum JCM 14848]